MESKSSLFSERHLQVEDCDANLTESLSEQGIFVEEAEVTEEIISPCTNSSSDSCRGVGDDFSCCDADFPECACSDEASDSFCQENNCINPIAGDLC